MWPRCNQWEHALLGKKFLPYNNSNYGVDLQSSVLYIISVFFFNRDNLLPVTVVGLLLHLLVTYGVTNKPFIIVSQGKPFKNYVIVHVCPFILNAFTDKEENCVLLLRNMPVNPDKRIVCYWKVLYFHAVSLCLLKNSLHKLCVLAASSNWLQDAVNDFGHRWVVQA